MKNEMRGDKVFHAETGSLVGYVFSQKQINRYKQKEAEEMSKKKGKKPEAE